MDRINLTGVSGSGKTTLARRLAQQLDMPHVELDALFWGPNWTETPAPIFRPRVDRALSGPRWVADGNYTSHARDLIWSRADTVLWLDYSLPVILVRLTRRTIGRAAAREELWSGNREQWRSVLFSRHSLLLWAVQSYPVRRREMRELVQRPEYAHLCVVQFRTPRETDKWLSNLCGKSK